MFIDLTGKMYILTMLMILFWGRFAYPFAIKHFMKKGFTDDLRLVKYYLFIVHTYVGLSIGFEDRGLRSLTEPNDSIGIGVVYVLIYTYLIIAPNMYVEFGREFKIGLFYKGEGLTDEQKKTCYIRHKLLYIDTLLGYVLLIGTIIGLTGVYNSPQIEMDKHICMGWIIFCVIYFVVDIRDVFVYEGTVFKKTRTRRQRYKIYAYISLLIISIPFLVGFYRTSAFGFSYFTIAVCLYAGYLDCKVGYAVGKRKDEIKSGIKRDDDWKYTGDVYVAQYHAEKQMDKEKEAKALKKRLKKSGGKLHGLDEIGEEDKF